MSMIAMVMIVVIVNSMVSMVFSLMAGVVRGMSIMLARRLNDRLRT